MGAFSTPQSNMAAKIVALVVVALALANAAPRDMSKLDNQVLEDKINEILASSELMQSAQADESPDWMSAARRTNSSTTFTQVLSFAFSHTTYTGALKSGVEVGYAKTLGSSVYANNAYVSGASVTSTAAAARRASSVTMTTTSNSNAAQSAAGNINLNTLNSNINSQPGVSGVSCSGASTPTCSSNCNTSGAAQLTFGFAALLAALFAHLF